MEWNKSNTTLLIECFKAKPELWDSTCFDFKDRHKKHAAWQEIADRLNTEKAVIEKKLRSLVGQFQRELRKPRSPGEEPTSKWFGFPLLSFLLDKNKVCASYRENSEGNEGSSHMSQDESKYMQFFDDSKDSSENARNFINCEPTYTPPAKKQKTDKDGDPIVESSRSQDDCALFADYMATEMRKIKDEAIIASVKHKISSIIFESQMKYFEDVKNKSKRIETSPPHSNNYSEKDFRTSIELVPIKSEIEID